MTKQYFSELLPNLAERSKLSSIGVLGFANEPLQEYLTTIFDQPFGERGSFLGDPTFEAVFGWKKGDKKMSDLAGNLLSKALVEAMDNPPKELRKDYRFAKNLKPYLHQIKSWEILTEDNPKSLIVASGTGSGKTECFMIPILDSLVKKQEQTNTKLTGVEAIFLYPLNALINSQRDRFRAWTNAFGGNIRFCLYNGNTPEQPNRTGVQPEYLSEVTDRTTLRTTPPSLLVTNATMLEYMLVRTSDAPIINQSQGKLKWIVLDEAHTYIGSQAAEAALLIRRVLLAFGVKPEQVRFVATSATIGDPNGDAGIKLKKFLADVAGVDQQNIELVAGQREIPTIDVQIDNAETNISEVLSDLETNENVNFLKIARNKTARQIREIFTSDPQKPVAKLSDISKTIFPISEKNKTEEYQESLRWLDILSQTKFKPAEKESEEEPFLPLRGHIFHQTLSGIWGCADIKCSEKLETELDNEKWVYGKIYFEPRKHCKCGSPVYELVKCDECAEVFLKGAKDSIGRIVHPQAINILDEFEIDTDNESFEEESDTKKTIVNSSSYQVLIINRDFEGLDNLSLYIDRTTRQKLDEPNDNSLTVKATEDTGSGLICPACNRKEDSKESLFRASCIGAPFLLGGILPTLLEYAPDSENPADSICRGRRLLSFNDSRQGTARIAAKLQQDAERNRIRSLIYHLTLAKRKEDNNQNEENLKKTVFQLRETLKGDLDLTIRRLLASQLEEKEKELDSLLKPKPLSFDSLADKLTHQGRDFDQMLDQYRRYAPSVFSEATGQLDLAKMFIVREFARRLRRMNNLESMGLVAIHYPALDRVSEVPSMVSEAAGFDLKEWRDFLKICLDFGVRSRGALEIPQTWRNWLGMRCPQLALVPVDSEFVGRGQVRWFRVNQRGRLSNLVKLLMFVLNADIKTSTGEDRINVVLKSAWQNLVDIGLLRVTADGRMMDLSQLSFVNMDSAWICPITKRFLDTTLRGVTPYTPENSNEKSALCEKVEIPIYDKPFANLTDELERIKKVREWSNQQEQIITLRKKGVWSDLNDRVIELSLYFTTAEHSAQQDSLKLQQYEKRFKEGKLNLLSCSTTMEMGIDIGGISMVAMNNVPPHPSNYLQRAGRAGRRRETQSVAVTLCKSNPHDQSVFKNTRWAFDTSLPAPNVSLDSAVIVERHINSYLLAKFFSQIPTELKIESIKLTSGSFFLGDISLSYKYIAWSKNFLSDSMNEIKSELSQIVKNSVLEGTDFRKLINKSASIIEKLSKEWLTEFELLTLEEKEFASTSKTPPVALQAVLLRKSRLTDEYLLKELATRGFLPAYGFPTNITPFDNLTVQQFIRNKQNRENSKREDNRFHRRELANRDIVTALREYAPGSEIIMDGLVYVSAGVLLNWHVPADADQVKEVQNLRFAWKCKECGASGSTPLLSDANTCKECGSEIEPTIKSRFEFLEPAGFAVDFYKEPKNDVSVLSFVPVEEPWINAGGEWFPLLNPSLGRFRTTTNGHVFHQSRGINGTGYAICLECGRAEPMSINREIPKIFQDSHKKLRRMKDEGSSCSGSNNSWKIKPNIVLGHESKTDVFELQLKDTNGIWLNDSVIALTLAVVIRDALAELLGIQANELGCSIKQARTDSTETCQSIIIFDRYSAGYASSASRFISELFKKVAEHLDCSLDCDSVCPNCVLDYDQRFSANNLDRHKAARFLTVEWLNGLKLPDDLAMFGESSTLEHHSFLESIILSSKESISKLRLFTSGKVEDWDIAPSNLRKIAYQIAGINVDVEIMIEKEILDKLSNEDKYLLSSLGEHPQINLLELDFSPQIENGWVLAEAIGGISTRWAVPNQESLTFNQDWAETDFLIRSQNSKPFSFASKIFNSDEIRPQLIQIGDKELQIKNELDGSIRDFGKRFWDFIKENHPQTKDLFENSSIVSVKYADRYLFNPLAIGILSQIIKSLNLKREVNGLKIPFTLTTANKDTPPRHRPTIIKNDWEDENVRIRVIKLVFDQPEIDFTLNTRNKNNTPHGRQLELAFSSNEILIIRFDQGVSYWKPAWATHQDIVRFDFLASDYQQRQRILSLNNDIEGLDFPTQIFVKKQN